MTKWSPAGTAELQTCPNETPRTSPFSNCSLWNRRLLVIPTEAKRRDLQFAPTATNSRWKLLPSPLSSRPERSEAAGSVVRSNRNQFSNGVVALPLVTPTGAKRSGGTCGSMEPLLECFSTERSASQIYRITKDLQLEVERNLSDACWRMPFRAFRPQIQKSHKLRPERSDLPRRDSF